MCLTEILAEGLSFRRSLHRLRFSIFIRDFLVACGL